MEHKHVIHVGVINNRQGFELYLATTEDGLNKQLANYCRDWWADGMAADQDPPKTDKRAIELYFQDHEREFLEIRDSRELVFRNTKKSRRKNGKPR